MRRALIALALLALPSTALADEGMWPFNMLPKDRIKKEHGADLSDAWIDKLRLASVRFNSGGSGSFVSPTGLVLTNHHVAADCVAKVASHDKDYLNQGYLSPKDGPELKCPDLELNVLTGIEDVTDRVKAARKDGMSDADANVAMKGEMSSLEKACKEKTGSRCDVVTLYAGGKYNLYSYTKYTDVRLVFAPEADIAFFGGDPDNFNYPRFDLDMALFRVYEAGKALSPKAFLKWNPSGPKDGESVFVSGHPGRTNRMNTMAQLAVIRDVSYPYYLEQFERERQALLAYGKQSKEAKRQIQEEIFGLENALKAYRGEHAGLKDAALMKSKSDAEAELKKAIEADPKLKAAYGTVFDDIAKVQARWAQLFKRWAILERASHSSILGAARVLVRLPAEKQLPNEKRLREFRESNMESLELQLFSPAPIYGEVEVANVRTWLERLVRDLGAADPLVKDTLGGRTPEVAARDIVSGSRLTDVYARRKLHAGGADAIAQSTDPAIAIMRALDAEARKARKAYEDEVEAPMRKHEERIAQALFAVKGTSMPPDATFTLRLSLGKVKGYEERGKKIPAMTTFGGLYQHATGQDPYKLPQRWLDKKKDLDPNTPMNFVSTDDIIGGNSGSPVVNAQGEIVGLIFDGNLPSLPNRFVYGETTARAVSVHTAAMTEALRKVYGADALAKELVDAK